MKHPRHLFFFWAISLLSGLGNLTAQEIKTPFFKGVKVEVMIGRPSKIEGGDFDDKRQVLKPRVKLTNTDVRQAYEGYKGSLMLIGESTIDSKIFKVLSRHEFGISLPIRKIQDEEAPEVTTAYDTTGAKFGYKFDGWILVVKDAQGTLALAKSSLPSLEKMAPQLDSLKAAQCYTKQLKPVEDPKRVLIR